MEKLKYTINIKAPVNKVYDKMLGLTNKSTYDQWTALFNPTSTYEGGWNKGDKILFVGYNEKGERGGMVSEIVENILDNFVSIRHNGLLKDNVEITEGPEVESWAGGLENYSFDENNGISTVIVEVDATEDFVDYMNENYPKALDKLKEICEE